jgi:hypothetical protein
MGILDRKDDEEIDSVIVQQNGMSAQGRRGQALMFDDQPVAPTQSAHALAVSQRSKEELSTLRYQGACRGDHQSPESLAAVHEGEHRSNQDECEESKTPSGVKKSCSKKERSK